MSEVTLKINNRGYNLACEPGQEEHLVSLAQYIDARLKDIAAAGAASDNGHLLVLTSLVLADEIVSLKDQLKHSGGAGMSMQQEEMLARIISQLADKIDRINERVLAKVLVDQEDLSENTHEHVA